MLSRKSEINAFFKVNTSNRYNLSFTVTVPKLNEINPIQGLKKNQKN